MVLVQAPGVRTAQDVIRRAIRMAVCLTDNIIFESDENDQRIVVAHVRSPCYDAAWLLSALRARHIECNIFVTTLSGVEYAFAITGNSEMRPSFLRHYLKGSADGVTHFSF